jgi:spermidine/putrescine transport system substrate-binding protein
MDEPKLSDAQLRTELERMRGLSRRRLLRSAGLAGATAMLAACGVKGTKDTGNAATTAAPGTTAPGTTAGTTTGSGTGGGSTGSASAGSTALTTAPAVPSVPDASDTDKTVNWSNWPEYIDIDENDPNVHPSIDAFTKETGIKVNYTEDINDNNQFFAKIQPLLSAGQAITADLFVMTDWMIPKLISLGMIQEIDHSNIPNLKNLAPQQQNVDFDPGRKYSITWQQGLTGIAFNPALTGGPVESMDQILTDPKLKGKVTLLSEMEDTIGLVLLDLGFDPGDFTDEQFDQAIAKVQAAVDTGQIRQFTGNDYGQGLASGDIAAAVAWTGDVVQLKADNPDLDYALPKAGGLIWSDNFVIPILTPHKRNAEKLINFYFQPDIAAQVADYINYITPVVGAKEVLMKDDPDVAKNQLIFPSEETLANTHVFMALDADQEKRYNAAFAKVSGA